MFLLSAHWVELEVHCDGDSWNHLASTRSRHGLQRHLQVLSVETLPIRIEILHWNLPSIRHCLALECVLGSLTLFLTIFLYHLLQGIWILLPFLISMLLSHWFFEDKFLMHPTFPSLPDLLSEYLLSKFPPRWMHTQERFLVKLSCQIDEVLTVPSQKSDDTPPSTQNELPAHKMVLQNAFHYEVINVSQITLTFHGMCPPFFIQTGLYKYRGSSLSHTAYCPFCHLSRFVGVLTYSDSTADLHRLCQIPVNYLCKSLSDCLGFEELLQAFHCFLWFFCWTWISL